MAFVFMLEQNRRDKCLSSGHFCAMSSMPLSVRPLFDLIVTYSTHKHMGNVCLLSNLFRRNERTRSAFGEDDELLLDDDEDDDDGTMTTGGVVVAERDESEL